MSHYSTGELANMFGLSKRTIQYYDHQHILKPAFTDDNQYRMYTEREVEQLHLILVMKSLGLSLKEIKQMLSAGGTLQTVRTLLTRKVEETGNSPTTTATETNEANATDDTGFITCTC